MFLSPPHTIKSHHLRGVLPSQFAQGLIMLSNAEIASTFPCHVWHLSTAVTRNLIYKMVIHYRKCNCEQTYNFTKVSKQFWTNMATGQVLFSLVSHCQICSPGHYKRSVTSSCCGTCDPCLGSNYTNTNSSTSCMMCPVNMWGNNPL